MSWERIRGHQLDIETGKAFQKDPKVLNRGQSQLATKLLTLWSQGKLSPPCIQELAHLTTLEDENPEKGELEEEPPPFDRGSLEHHLLLACFPKSSTCPQTWPKLWEWITWSFRPCKKASTQHMIPMGTP